MKSKDIEILIEKYLNGETTPEEEKALAAEVSRDDAPQEWKIIAEMLGELTVDEALYDNMMAERNKKSRIMKLWPWVAAACVAAILLMIPTPPKSPLTPERGESVAKVEEVKSETSKSPLTPERGNSVARQEATVIGGKAESASVTKPKVNTVMKTTTTNLIAKVELTEETSQPTELASEPATANPSSEPSQAAEDIFDATLANVRRAALQKMMSCDMQCMNEDINLRATHLSTLIQEQNQ
ncbi:MAG: hypothetical protein MJZ29_07945 [Bacteroidaceae bacterium]|nr:hypothetical protein [Bacteroidaceae bacterium]